MASYLSKDGLTYFWGKIKDTLAPIISPVFSGTPTAPTADTSTNTKQIATTEFVTSKISGAGTIDKSGGFLVESKAIDNITLSNTTVNTSVSVAKSGYTPIMVVGYAFNNATSSGSNSYDAWLYRLHISGTTLYYAARAIVNRVVKVKLTAYILYRKN